MVQSCAVMRLRIHASERSVRELCGYQSVEVEFHDEALPQDASHGEVVHTERGQCLHAQEPLLHLVLTIAD